MPSRGRSNPRVSPWAISKATPLGFKTGGFAFIPTHGPNSQNFNCGVILPVLAAPFEPNSRPTTEAVGYFISPSEFETTSEVFSQPHGGAAREMEDHGLPRRGRFMHRTSARAHARASETKQAQVEPEIQTSNGLRPHLRSLVGPTLAIESFTFPTSTGAPNDTPLDHGPSHYRIPEKSVR